MGVTKERDLEAALADPATFDSQSSTPVCQTPKCHTPKCCTPQPQTPECHTPKAVEEESQSSVKSFLPVMAQKELYVSTIGEALSVGLGLGSAVGVWAVINEVMPIRPHFSNWVCGLIMGLFLAPFLDKAARLIFGKLFCVLKKPRFSNWTRIIDHVIVVFSAFCAIGPMKAVQRQYGPLHSSVGFEYLVFVLGFTAYSFVRSMLFTLVLNHDYERETVTCSWRQLPVELFWEYLDQFHHVFVLISENLRDILLFSIYPYLATLWFEHWDVIDPNGKFLWVAHWLNIGFFFTSFVIMKESTYLVATPFWSPDLPHHHHHSL